MNPWTKPDNMRTVTAEARLPKPSRNLNMSLLTIDVLSEELNSLIKRRDQLALEHSYVVDKIVAVESALDVHNQILLLDKIHKEKQRSINDRVR